MKAIILLSGGLDSTIAAELMSRENIELLAVNYKTPFCLCDRPSAKGGCGSHAKRVAGELGIEIKIINATEEFLEVLKAPKHGYGANVNPCIDCRILFFKKSKELMEEYGASFIITGEVLGQRPMSQHKRQMLLIEKESGLEGLVVKPLSAQLMPPTIPEKEGWINRDNLLAIAGRSRKPQIALAKEYGVKDYPCAAGGCLLTVSTFAPRIKDLIKHDSLNVNNIGLVKIGRHFRLSEKAKLVVGRNESENELLVRYSTDKDIVFSPIDTAGPTAIGRGSFSEEEKKLAVSIVIRYCDAKEKAEILLRDNNAEYKFALLPAEDAILKEFRL